MEEINKTLLQRREDRKLNSRHEFRLPVRALNIYYMDPPLTRFFGIMKNCVRGVTNYIYQIKAYELWNL